ncbi:uncharacterized protein LOC126884398 [Diabrotica virgifera virgifera]|uniref:Reverse transcriptase domain-containing protein n=1 Tax=Diabrotica virgifera virgifera TaxID=50390 RepID=A0ABM5K7V8_DIAVI|nr:uncharacterized protein LOC126884398 [Diabrotica virgifera virgifera]
MSSIGAPTEKIATLVTDILTTSYDLNNEYYIKDSFEVKKLVENVTLPPNYILASLDVVSLFSNVYLEACLRSIQKRWDIISTHCKIDLETFLELVTFLFDNTYFTFDNKIYKSTFGTPMGAKVSPILAAYVVDDILDTVIPVLPYNLTFVKKYVDDIILALPKDQVEDILSVFNSYDPYIQFTIEVEDNEQSVPFLDTKLIRTNNNNILVDWYRKPTASGRYLHYLSYHKHSMKINLLKQMKARVMKISV